MIESFRLKNYRGFKDFELSQLGRINLFVGENNSGKTSILEAIHLFISYPYFSSLLEIFKKRGEFTWIDSGSIIKDNESLRRIEQKFNAYNIFNNDSIEHNHKIELNIIIDRAQYYLNIVVNRKSLHSDFINSLQTVDESSLLNKIELSFSWHKNEQKPINLIKLPLSITGDITALEIQKWINERNFIFDFESNIKNELINPFEQDIDALINIFDQISLTSKEDIVIEALRIIEPKIRRIASTKSKKGEKSNLKVLLEGHENPLSIASMGDGIWQLLTIALAMVNNQDGVLLIDEIDTGLHFSTLEKMWQLILETAQKLNVQVFATTHNSDCWTSLGKVITNNNLEQEKNLITLHRIEKDKSKSILFNAQEIVTATDYEMEVR